MNVVTLTLPDEAPLEITINGEPVIMIRKSALYSAPSAITSPHRSVRASKPTVERPKAKPSPEAEPASEPLPGSVAAAVLEELRRKPGMTSLETFDAMRAKHAATTAGGVYSCIRRLLAAGLVEKGENDAGRACWHPTSH